MRRPLSLLAAALLGTGPLLAAPHPAAAAGGFTVDLHIPQVCHDADPATPGAYREFPQQYGSVAAGDIFGDGRREIAVNLPDGTVRLYDTAGTELWRLDTGDTLMSAPTLADLDGGGRLSLIVSSFSGDVDVFTPSGGALAMRPGWPRHSSVTGYGGSRSPGFASSVAVGDIYADGRKELFASALDLQTYGWFADGSPVPGWPHTVFDSAVATPLLFDYDNVHRLDVITPSDSSGGAPIPSGTAQPGGIYWGWRWDGSQIAATSDINTDQVPWSSPAADDLISPGTHVIVNGTGDNQNFAGRGHRIDGFTGGQNAVGFPVGTGSYTFASPAVGDIFGDGRREVVDVSEDDVLDGVYGDGSAMAGVPMTLPYTSPYVVRAGPAIAPVGDGSGHDGVWVADNNHLVGLSMSPTHAPTVQQDITVDVTGFNQNATPTITDLGTGSLSVITVAEYNNNCAPGTMVDVRIAAYPIPNTGTTMPAWSWPTFHGNMQRTGSNLPLAPVPQRPAHGYWLVASDGGLFPFGSALEHSYGSTGGMHLNAPIVGMAGTTDDNGYWLVASDGGVFPFGDARQHSYGSTGGIHLNAPIVGMAATGGGNGYWLVASDGGIFPFGDAQQHSYGSTGGMHLNAPIVGMAPTRSGNGYWLVASDGGIFPFGDALEHSYGSTGGIHLNQPVVGMQPTMSGNGYWLVASDGGIFPFGDALQHSHGSTGGIHLNRPVVGMAATGSGDGYWLVASDGGIFPFGDAGQHSYGSTGGTHLNQPVVGMAATMSGNGYWLVAADGGVFPFGDAAGYGSTGGSRLNRPIVGMAATRLLAPGTF